MRVQLSRSIAIIVAVAAMAALAFMLYGLLTHPDSTKMRGLPPQPMKYPKAYCGPKITHVNVVFWGGRRSESDPQTDTFDGFSHDREMEHMAQLFVRKFWARPVSVISTNDYTNITPKHLGQLVLSFKRLDNGVIGISGEVFQDVEMREKIIKSIEAEQRPLDLDNQMGTLQLKSDFQKDEKVLFLISSLSDIVSGRCDRVMSSFIQSDSRYWKFFPPNEFFNGKDGIGEGIAK